VFSLTLLSEPDPRASNTTIVVDSKFVMHIQTVFRCQSYC